MGIDELNDELVKQTEKYIGVLEKSIIQIKNAKPDDRLDYAFEFSKCLNAMEFSIKYWKNWIENLTALIQLKVEDWKFVYPKIKNLAVDFLTVDLEITKTKTKDFIDKQKKRKKQKKEKEPYVS